VAALVAAYQRGGAVSDLARDFGINRDTVYAHLKRQGIELRETGLQPDELLEAIRLYEDGWSLGRLATEFDVSPSTVNRALCQAGVHVRRPGPPRVIAPRSRRSGTCGE